MQKENIESIVIDKFIKKINDIKSWYKSIIKSVYYYVPACPECGSMITGRYIKSNITTPNDWIKNEALRHGEIVETVAEISYKNCFCVACGYEWFSDIKTKFFKLDEIEDQKALRHTNELLSMRYKEQEKYEKEHPKNFVTDFIGPI